MPAHTPARNQPDEPVQRPSTPSTAPEADGPVRGLVPVDPRGARFTAALTSLVLALVLLGAPAVWAIVLLAAQTLVFAVGATRGATATPYAVLFRRLIRPRLAPPAELEDPRPPRFAQTVGLAFTTVGLAALLAGVTLPALLAVAAALIAALLNAAFGLCLGCELYLLTARTRTTRRATAAGPKPPA